MEPSVQTTNRKRITRVERVKSLTVSCDELAGEGWWITKPMDQGLTDIAVLIPGFRIRVGSLASRNNGRAWAVHYVIDLIGALRPEDAAALEQVQARHGCGSIWYDEELRTLHLYAEGPRKSRDSATANIDALVFRIRQLFTETAVRALMRRSM